MKSRKQMINEICALYDAYLEKVKELERSRKFTDGLLGITKGPKDDACHDWFADELETRLRGFAAADPSTEEIRSLLEYMYRAPLKNKDNHMVYWMFAAVHSLVLETDLISRLDREAASDLYRQYFEDYPRWERLPAQKRTLKALKMMI